MTKLKLGDKVLCTNDNRRRWWKKGKVYEVTKTETTNKLIVIDEDGDRRDVRIIENYLNKGLALNFELVKEKYTENDLELGDKLLCTKSEVDHWISGKMYELKLNKLGVLEIKDEDGDEAYSSYLLECLNKEWDLVEFELIKKEENNMKYNKGELQAGMKLKCISTTKKNWWVVGKTYEIKKHDNGLIYLTDETGYNWHEDAILDFLSKNELFNAKLEIVKEENNMQDLKVGDLVEVVKNNSHAYKNKSDFYQVGDKAIVTEVVGVNVRIGDVGLGNLIGKHEVKKVEQSPEQTPELTEYEEEIVLRLAEKIKEKDMLERNMNNLMAEIQYREELANKTEQEYEKVSKEIKEITKKLLTK